MHQPRDLILAAQAEEVLRLKLTLARTGATNLALKLCAALGVAQPLLGFLFRGSTAAPTRDRFIAAK